MAEPIVGADPSDTHQKALQINLDPRWYGTIAEIGAGQQVARGSFRVGGAAGAAVLGLGFPTLIPTGGVDTMHVADVDGVRLQGLLFDAGTTNSNTLLQIGPAGSSATHASNPISVQDVFFRIGGDIAGLWHADPLEDLQGLSQESLSLRVVAAGQGAVAQADQRLGQL